MKTLVLGIVVVFCLQMLFVGYTSIERQMGALAEVDEIADEANPLADVPESFEYEVPIAPRSTETVPVWTHRKRTVRRIESARVIVARNASANSTLVANSSRANEPKTLSAKRARTEYPASEVETNLDAQTEVAKNLEEKESKDKRSFVSRSVSVIKKPYDWLKALGSKLK